MSTATERIGVKLAGALLLQYGEISTEYIRAMPFLSDPGEVEKVISELLKLFNVEVHQRMVSSHPTPEWEEIIMLKGPYLEEPPLSRFTQLCSTQVR
jgi:hypothetical protein